MSSEAWQCAGAVRAGLDAGRTEQGGSGLTAEARHTDRAAIFTCPTIVPRSSPFSAWHDCGCCSSAAAKEVLGSDRAPHPRRSCPPPHPPAEPHDTAARPLQVIRLHPPLVPLTSLLSPRCAPSSPPSSPCNHGFLHPLLALLHRRSSLPPPLSSFFPSSDDLMTCTC